MIERYTRQTPDERDRSIGSANRGDTPRLRLALKVVPGASKESVDGWLGHALKVRVRAPAERGKANEAVERLVARALGLGDDDVSIVSGHASPRKTIEIQGLSAEEIQKRIAALAD